MAWTRLFQRSALTGGPTITDLMEGLARLAEGMGEEEVYRVACRELTRIFKAARATLYWNDPAAARSTADGEWVLRAVAGEERGALLRQTDLAGLELLPGATHDVERAAGRACLLAIAAAFEQGELYGCDVEGGRVALLKNPGPDDDLGSGALTLLAIPLIYQHRLGRALEKARVGVLVLHQVPVASDLRPLEGFLGTLVGYAMTTPSCTLRDPVTGLYSAAHLVQQLRSYLNMFELTKRKLGGGLVVGRIDALGLWQQSLEAGGTVPPALIDQRVAEVVRSVAGCVSKLSSEYSLPNAAYQCGTAARVGRDGFAALLPLLTPEQLRQWATRLARSVHDLQLAEDPVLPGGRASISTRVFTFGLPGTTTPESTWQLALECLEHMGEDQARAAGRPDLLANLVQDHQVMTATGWEPLTGRARPPRIGHGGTLADDAGR